MGFITNIKIIKVILKLIDLTTQMEQKFIILYTEYYFLGFLEFEAIIKQVMVDFSLLVQLIVWILSHFHLKNIEPIIKAINLVVIIINIKPIN